MIWTIDEGYGIPSGTHYHMRYPQEVSLVSFTLHLSPLTHKQRYHRLQQAYGSGALRLGKRIHALLAFAEAMSVRAVAELLPLGEQTVRDSRHRFLVYRMAS